MSQLIWFIALTLVACAPPEPPAKTQAVPLAASPPYSLKKVPLIYVASVGSEPHLVPLTALQKILWSGGLLLNVNNELEIHYTDSSVRIMGHGKRVETVLANPPLTLTQCNEISHEVGGQCFENGRVLLVPEGGD